MSALVKSLNTPTPLVVNNQLLNFLRNTERLTEMMNSAPTLINENVSQINILSTILTTYIYGKDATGNEINDLLSSTVITTNITEEGFKFPDLIKIIGLNTEILSNSTMSNDDLNIYEHIMTDIGNVFHDEYRSAHRLGLAGDITIDIIDYVNNIKVDYDEIKDLISNPSFELQLALTLDQENQNVKLCKLNTYL